MARKDCKDRGLVERPKRSGIWWIRYVGPDRSEHCERGGTKTEARTLLARRRTEIDDGTWCRAYGHGARPGTRERLSDAGAQLTVGELAERWLAERKPHLTRQVDYNYRTLLRAHLLSRPLARKALAEITEESLAGLVNDLRTPQTAGAKVLSPNRINNLLKRLRSIFRFARRRKLITDDPMEFVQLLREPKPDVEPFDLDEALRIIGAAVGWERTFLSVLLFTGMRPGEALALRWDDLDFEHGLIRVRRTVHPRFGIGLPKTPGSEREVEMNLTVRIALLEQQPRSQLKGELVFPSLVAKPIDLQNFRLRNWRRILRRAKVRPRVLYQCRHTFVRLALENGDHPQHIAAMLGHVSTEMVFKRYGRWMQRPESAALARLDAAIQARRKLVAVSGQDRAGRQPDLNPSKSGHDSGHDLRLRLAEIQ